MKQFKSLPLLAITFMVMLIASCKKTDMRMPDVAGKSNNGNMPDNPGFAENDVVLFWNEKASIILSGSFTPPAQTRYFAMVQIAVHDALNAIKPKYQRFAMVNERSHHANPDAAVASASYWTFKELNIGSNHPLDEWYAASIASIPEGESKIAGLALGKKAAEAIILNRAGDNFIMSNQQVQQPEGINPGEYKSTLPFSLPNMPKIKALHQWGTMMKPFVTQSNSQFRPSAPFPVNSPQYITEYNEVKTKGGKTPHTRTSDETEIGVFWVERSSIGWNRFARNVVATQKMDAWKTARLFALLHTAMIDGVSGCFEAKYHYKYWRPETAIRQGDDDGNSNTAGDVTWLPSYIEGPNILNPAMNMYTPPLPDYPSAHANFGGAAAAILKRFFETDQTSVNQTSLTLPGVTRNYTSFSKAARDNSLSRIYVGYHFRLACLKGEEQGDNIGTYVFENSFRPL